MTNQVRHAAATDIGLARDTNEDSFLAEPPLFAVADGMGGHMAGDVASRLALEALATKPAVGASQLADAIREANRHVHSEAIARPELHGMGTTITAMVAGPQDAEIAHVGDSRAYLLRHGSLTRLTRDHTVVERMVREGRIAPDEAEHHPQRSYLERALGVEPDVEVDSYNITTEPGDRILLCTDGLTTMLDEETIRGILELESDPDKASKALVAAAVDAGGSDNVTVVVVDYPGSPEMTAPQTALPQEAPPQRSKIWKRRRLLIRAAVIAAVLLVALLAIRAVALSRWYVGEDEGQVVVLRGIPGVLRQVEERTEITSSSLPEDYQKRLEEGMTATDREDARDIVDNLREIQMAHGAEATDSSGGPP
jgi:protein phosphatase